MNDSKISLATILGAICIVAVLVFIFMPVYSGRPLSVRLGCLSNAKQVAVSSIIYASDYDDRYISSIDWMDQTRPYIRNESVLHCPVFNRNNKSIYGYAMSINIFGVLQNTMADPASKVLLFDSVILERNAVSNLVGFPDPPRHRKNSVSFADGHAKAEVSLAKYR